MTGIYDFQELQSEFCWTIMTMELFKNCDQKSMGPGNIIWRLKYEGDLGRRTLHFLKIFDPIVSQTARLRLDSQLCTGKMYAGLFNTKL